MTNTIDNTAVVNLRIRQVLNEFATDVEPDASAILCLEMDEQATTDLPVRSVSGRTRPAVFDCRAALGGEET